MVRIRHSASDRTAVRLISTPTPSEESLMSTTIAGVRFSDQTAALLDHAIAHGFRVEQNDRGKAAARNGGSVICYPPNPDQQPITIAERNGKFNKPHYENLRRDLYRAGLVPLPGDTRPVPPEPTVLVNATTGEHQAVPPQMKDPARRAEFIASVVQQLGVAGNMREAEAALAGAVVLGVMTSIESTAELRNTDSEVIRLQARKEVLEEVEGDIAQALEMAQSAERERDAARRQLEAATARETKARTDCGAALERARVAEARAEELERVLAPLRAFMSASGS